MEVSRQGRARKEVGTDVSAANMTKSLTEPTKRSLRRGLLEALRNTAAEQAVSKKEME